MEDNSFCPEGSLKFYKPIICGKIYSTFKANVRVGNAFSSNNLRMFEKDL